MQKVVLELTFPNVFTETDIQNTVNTVVDYLLYKGGVRPTIDIHNSIFDKILDWAKIKGILDNGDAKTQTCKLAEEFGELAHGILKQNKEEVKDAIGDMIVVLTSIAYFNDLTVPECIESAYEVISKRNGKMENGNFVKD